MFAIRAVLFAAAVAWSLPAVAAECDCSQHTGSCSANGQLDAGHQIINFTATTQACAQITYSVDGAPSSVTVEGGSGSVDYLVTDPSRQHKLQIQSCNVCGSPNAGAAPPKFDNATFAAVQQACSANCMSDLKAGFAQCSSMDCDDQAYRGFAACLVGCNKSADAAARSK